MAENLLHRFGHHYILVMMILTRVFGSAGGLLVIYYVELTLQLPPAIRTHFRLSSIVVVVVACTLTVLLALWETRVLRKVLRQMQDGQEIDSADAAQAGHEATVFVGRHHRHEAWLVPCTTLLPVLIFLKIMDDASPTVMLNITLAVFMGISMALMSTFFAVEHSMQPVIRRLLKAGALIDYDALPPGRLHVRFGLCSSLIIMTTALMIGTLAGQRATDIIASPEHQAEAVASLRNHSVYITIAAVLTGIVFSAVLSNSVASRARTLVQAMERVAAGNLAERVRPTGTDEVDRLARQFNRMVGQLENHDLTIRDLNANLEHKVLERTRQLESALQELRDAQSKLTDVAHRAGMAEIATGVLHNVGNVLNSVNISTTVLTDRLRRSRVSDLQRFAGRLTGQADDLASLLGGEGRGRKMLEYLEMLATTLAAEQGGLLEELDSLGDKVDHIRGIIAAQQGYARRVTFKEPVDLAVLLNDVLDMHQHACVQHCVELVREFAELPEARLEKSKLVQVLDNLVKNAIESMAQHPGRRRVLTLRIERQDSERARIVVADTGGGISPEHLNSIFTYGFTTKQTGNGFGLHSSALAVAELGGVIRVHSDGPGRGATFTVELPLAARTAAGPSPALPVAALCGQAAEP